MKPITLCLTAVAAACAVLVPASVPAESGRSLNKAVARAFAVHEFARAESLSVRAWDLSSESEPIQAGIAAAHMGAVYAIRGWLQTAQVWQERAAALLASQPKLAARVKVASALTAFLVSRQYGNPTCETALVLLAEARKECPRVAEDCELVLKIRSNDGEMAQAAYLRLQSRLNEAESNGDSLVVATCAMRLGWLEGSTGGHRTAARYFGRAYAIFDAGGHAGLARLSLRNAGLACWRSGDPEAGTARLYRALSMAASARDSRMEAVVLNDLSMVATALGHTEDAIALDRRAATAMARVIKGVASGDLRDDVITDFLLTYKLRYIGKPIYLTEYFSGFLEYLVLDPEVS